MRVCLPVQGTWVQSLVREDATCLRAATPVSHNYEVHMLQVLKPECLEPGLASKRGRHGDDPCPAVKSVPHLPQLEKACARLQRPSTAKNKCIKKIYIMKELH